MNAEKHSYELSGLSVNLDKLLYRHAPETSHQGKPHLFVYFITIRNDSAYTIQLLGRKWVMTGASGEIAVIEGEKIVGHTPVLKPGEHFSYNSFHLTSEDCTATGAFHGMDMRGDRVFVRIPQFCMSIPEEYRDID